MTQLEFALGCHMPAAAVVYMSYPRTQEDDMTGTTRIPAAEITGFKGALIKRFAKKTLGQVPSSLGVYWHNQKEARRCLKRRLSDMVYRQLVADAKLAEPTAAARIRGRRWGGSGRALGGVTRIQRGRPSHPGHRLFGSATARTRITDATRPAATPDTPRGLGSEPSASARRSRQGERPTGRTTLTATSTDAHSAVPKPRS
jgi:hypothetical protein